MTEAATPVISLGQVTRWYANVVAVNDVSFEVWPGITGLLGPNGAGKTTILNMLVGLLAPSRGEVRAFGEPVRDNPPLYRRIGFVSERDAVYEFMTCREFVTLMARLHGLEDPEAAAAAAIAVVDLEDAQDRRLGEYSKGMRQRAKVAAGIVHDPDLLILDEPFSGTDPRQRLQMMKALERMAADGRAILFSSHILEEVAQVATSVLVLVAGRLAASGNYRQIRRLMTDRPHTIRVNSSDNRRLAASMVSQSPVSAVELLDGRLMVRTSDLTACARLLPRVAHEGGLRLYEVVPLDLSLESVFSYLVERR
ncbi:MAG TPA: ABC transporter ATP-binding protein [Dehalococcoidia bacterium]|nr:ABC transporter ATP-binding protein [Dehalococcoidia bacterium]